VSETSVGADDDLRRARRAGAEDDISGHAGTDGDDASLARPDLHKWLELGVAPAVAVGANHHTRSRLAHHHCEPARRQSPIQMQ